MGMQGPKRSNMHIWRGSMSSNCDILLVPCPLQGHLTPMLHLAQLLHSRGFPLSLFLPRPGHHSDFFVESIHVDAHDDAHGLWSIINGLGVFSGDVLTFLLELNTKLAAPFRELLARKRAKEGEHPRAVCIIHDAVLYCLQEVAHDLEIPRIVLRTSSATNFLGLSLLKQRGWLATQEEQNMKESGKEVPFLRQQDMPFFNKTQETMDNIFGRIDDATTTASALIWNSLTCLEQPAFDKITKCPPMFPIGPLHKPMSPPSTTSQDAETISWLNAQTPGSVIFVSTGSLVQISRDELLEMAWGLAHSGHPFFWVVRPGLLADGSNGLDLLREITGGRGRVVRWAPQQEVLGHEAVGGFWTHNGWNSTVESASAGVPMLCWPRIGDQRVNARLASHVWRVGILMEGKVERGKVEGFVRRLMVGKEAKQMRKRGVQLKHQIEASCREGGDSYNYTQNLLQFINTI